MMVKRETWIMIGVAAALVAGAVVCVFMPEHSKLKELQGQIVAAKMAIAGDSQRAAIVPEMARQVEEMKTACKQFLIWHPSGPGNSSEGQAFKEGASGYIEDRRLPRQKELGGFLKEISTILEEGDSGEATTLPANPGTNNDWEGVASAGGSKLAVQLIEPGSPTRGELFNTLPITMRFRGTYRQACCLMKRLEQMERLTRIQKLSIKKTCLDEQASSDRDTPAGTSPKSGYGMDVEIQMNIYFTEG
jgi:Tfp pilus assembly protein PilO